MQASAHMCSTCLYTQHRIIVLWVILIRAVMYNNYTALITLCCVLQYGMLQYMPCQTVLHYIIHLHSDCNVLYCTVWWYCTVLHPTALHTDTCAICVWCYTIQHYIYIRYCWYSTVWLHTTCMDVLYRLYRITQLMSCTVIQYCTICTVPYRTALQRTIHVLYCSVLCSAALCCAMLHCTALCCTTLHYALSICSDVLIVPRRRPWINSILDNIRCLLRQARQKYDERARATFGAEWRDRYVYVYMHVYAYICMHIYNYI